MPALIGTLLNGRYRLDAQLGQGGMGRVYRAHDTLLDRDVAVKVISGTGLGTEARARLLREAQAAAGLNHPNIVSVHDAGEARLPAGVDQVDSDVAWPFVVMELVEGPSLYQRRTQSLEETLCVARQVCAALDHAHDRGIVHRDLKPENVLLTAGFPGGSGATAKLVDFGLARSVASRLTGEGHTVGTVFYLAPELALGQPYDGRADLYALGIMLYELTTGRLPFIADDPLAVISQHLHAPAVPPRARDERVPPALDTLILRLLSKDAADRPASAAEVLRVLEAPDTLDREAVPPRELSVLERIERGRLVARDRELAEARAHWRRAAAGEGGMLLVSGEPGVGKSRLVRELCTEVHVAGGRALVGECYAEGGAPYAPFAQILRRAFRDGPGESLVEALPDFVLADLLTLAPGLRVRYPDVPANPSLDPRSEQQRMFENVVTLCRTLTEHAPLLLVLEDAHWADSGSLALLRHLARRTRRQPLFLVATYREVELDQTRPFQEVLLDLNRERLATRLRLSRLDRQGTRDMLSALFAEEITAEFLDGIYRETEGNPFFVEEVCRALVESGQVYFVNGAWARLAMEELEIPQSVRIAIQSRVSRLRPDCQDMLRLAAILGREFEFQTLLAAGEADEEDLIVSLESATQAQLVAEVGAARDVVFAFTHALIPAILVDSVSTLRRRRLHSRVAVAIERLHPDDFEALAYHYGEAGDEARALACHTHAGLRASARFANVEAEGHFRAALDLAEAEVGQADLLWELGRVLNRQSRYDDAIEVWQKGIALYRAQGAPDGVARLYARSARAAWKMGDTPEGLRLCREGMEAVAAAPQSQETANLLHETARACFFNGLPDEAASLCHQALAMAEQTGDVRLQAEALTTLGVLPSLAPDEAVAALARAIELAESAGLLEQAARAHNNFSVKTDDARAAQEHLLRAAELDRQRGEIIGELFYRISAEHRLLLQGDLASVERSLLALRQSLDAVPRSDLIAMALSGLECRLLRFRGELPEAFERLKALRKAVSASGNLDALTELDEEAAVAYIWDGTGDRGELEDVLQELLDLDDRGMGTLVRALSLMSMDSTRQGELEDAHRLLARAREQAALEGSTETYGPFLALAAASLAVAGQRWDEAMAYFEAAVATLGRRHLRWHRARLLIDWGAAHARRDGFGDRERAQEIFREARAEFEAMGVPVYVERINARLAALGRGQGTDSPSGSDADATP